MANQAGQNHWLARQAAIWILLSLFTAIVVRAAPLPIAFYNPTLATGLATIVGVSGIALFRLGVTRYRVLASPAELLIGLAFGILGAVTLLVDVGLTAANFQDPSLPMRNVIVSTLARSLAAVLLLLGALSAAAQPRPRARRGLGILISAATLLPLTGAIAFIMLSPAIPTLVDARVFDSLAGATTVNGPTPGQANELIGASGMNALLLLLAAVGYVALAKRRAEPHFEAVATGLTLLAFGWIHSLLLPPAGLGYVSTSDVLGLSASVMLLFSVGTHTMAEVSEHASRDERLRLSRELHDGLAQQLSLLHLRLRQAGSAQSDSERSRHLQAALQVTEASMLEAREAITALRTGIVTWTEFTGAFEGLCDEFAQNHEVTVRATTTGNTEKLGADVQSELLRVVQEALNNAVRHGAAREILVAVTGDQKKIGLVVQDDGCGFDATAIADNSLGLRFMKERLDRRGGSVILESSRESGTVVRVSLPLA